MFHCMYITHFVYLLSSTDDHVARLHLFFVAVQTLSHVQLLETPWTVSCHVPLSFSTSRSLLKFYPLSQ